MAFHLVHSVQFRLSRSSTLCFHWWWAVWILVFFLHISIAISFYCTQWPIALHSFACIESVILHVNVHVIKFHDVATTAAAVVQFILNTYSIFAVCVVCHMFMPLCKLNWDVPRRDFTIFLDYFKSFFVCVTTKGKNFNFNLKSLKIGWLCSVDRIVAKPMKLENCAQ